MLAEKNDMRAESATGAADLGLLPDLVGYNLRRAQFAVFQDFMQTLAGLALTPGQFGVLEIVASNPGMKQTDLANALNVDRSTVVGVIDRLEERGLLERAAAANDRRSHALHLTAAGEALLGEAKLLVARHEAAITAGLSASEKAQLVRSLQRIAGIESS